MPSFTMVENPDILAGLGAEGETVVAPGYLIDRGHERIAFVGGPMSIGQVRDRLEGGRAAWAAAGRAPGSLVVITTGTRSRAASRQKCSCGSRVRACGSGSTTSTSPARSPHAAPRTSSTCRRASSARAARRECAARPPA